MPEHARLKWLWLAVACMLGAAFSHLVWGGTTETFGEVVRAIAHGPTKATDDWIVWQIRMPRTLACLFIGGMLGVVGSAFQSLFRNPLADPYIVGASSGASVGGVLVIVSGLASTYGVILMPVAGFIAASLALSLVFALARRPQGTDTVSLLLAGTVTSTMLAAIQSGILLAGGKDSNVILRWLLGSMNGVFWPQILLLVLSAIFGSLALLKQSRYLNLLSVGEESASAMGVDIVRVRRVTLLVGTAMVAVCVGTVGIIGFLGLAAPHIARRLFSVDSRITLLASFPVGAILLLLSDGICQHLGEWPVGLVTALLGAPSLLILMKREL